MKIILDAHGGDNAPTAVLKGAKMAIDEFKIEILLVGREAELKDIMKKEGISESGFSFLEAAELIGYDEEPMDAVRSKKNSTIVVGLTALTEKKGDAFISAGNTGVLLMGGTLIVKRIKGVLRPALAPVMPSAKTPFMLIDCGANAEAKPEYLAQFGILGSAYMEKIIGTKNPRVGILNIGTEKNKGTDLQREAYEILEKMDSINFVGNVESRDVPDGACDVAVCDGFIGNIFLKTYEGVAMCVFSMLKDVFKQSIITKLAAGFLMSGLKKMKNRMDYKEYGGAPLLGLAAPVFKAHGSSDATAIFNTIRQARVFVERGVIATMTEEIAKYTGKEPLSK